MSEMGWFVIVRVTQGRRK